MSRVNVLLFTDNHFDYYFIRPSGTYRIATEIRKAGYTCQVVDFFGFMTNNDIEKIIDKYVGKETLVVGFGSTFITASSTECYTENSNLDKFITIRQNIFNTSSYEQLYTVKYPFSNDVIKDLMEKCKTKNPNIKFVYGGGEAKYKNAYGIDCFFTNDNGDMDIIDYLNKLSNNEILPHSYDTTNKTDFDFNSSKIIWDKSDLIFQNELLPIEISRGCIFKCTFCNFSMNGKKKFDYIKEPSILREEFIRNYETYGTTNYIFCDDTFNDSTYKLELLLNEVTSKLPFKISFGSYLRLDLINAHKEQIDLLRELGLKSALFGIESINTESLKKIGKMMTKDKMENMMLELKEKWCNDVLTTGSFIYGLPGETKETLKEYERWLIEDSLNYFDFVSLFPLHISLNENVDNKLKSAIAINFNRYGYKKDTEEKRKNYNWVSEEMGIDYVQAHKKVDDIVTKMKMDNRYKLGGSGLGALGYYNVGATFEQLKTMPYTQLIQNNFIKENFINKINEYKIRLING